MKLRELLQRMDTVHKKIGTSEPYICGGVPRDKYLKRLDRISDIDITTGDKSVDYLSQEFANNLKKDFNITRKVMDDGHSTIYIGNLKIDFSSNFIVPNVDKILFNLGLNKITNMQRELFSRDFTCNALLLSFDLKNLIDPTNMGFKDIRDKKIRTCLKPEITLTSNRNRVIRSIYLAAKLDFDIDDSIINYVSNHPESVQISSQKALIEKINEAFKWDADKSSYLLTKMNLWKYVPITELAYPYYMKFGKGVK